MTRLEDHPTVQRMRARAHVTPAPLDAETLRALCLEAGADDVGFVSLDDPALDVDRAHVLEAMPKARTIVSLVFRMNRANVQSPSRSVANLEFHHTGDHVNDVARDIVTSLERMGHRAINPAMAFPMEMSRFPGKAWILSHKLIAEAAGMGRIGLHRNIIHPVFGNFVLLGGLILEADLHAPSAKLDYNPCLECALCVAACPVGAVHRDGTFDFSACYTHNYREFLSGFGAWVEQVADSTSARDYRNRVTDAETASMWQSLAYGPNYNAAYCMAVCPAGEDVISPFLEDRGGYLKAVLKPLQIKEEAIYLIEGSDADAFVQKRYPHKTPRYVDNALRTSTAADFLRYVWLRFQPGRAGDLAATYHFTFTSPEWDEPLLGTIDIRDARIEVQTGHQGEPDLRVEVDERAWLGIVNKDHGPVGPLLRRKLKVKGGSPRLLEAFAHCFP